MGNTYNYSKLAFTQEFKRHPYILLILLVLLTIPLSYAINSIALGLLVAFSLITLRLRYFVFNNTLFLPVALYLLMLVSLVWSIDSNATSNALAKELPLLLIPLCFMLFPALSSNQRNTILRFYSWGIVVYCIFYLLQAILRYVSTGDASVFFYHELVTKDVNAIHVSVYVAIAFFYFFTKSGKDRFEILASILLFAMVFLLSSKNIIIAFAGLIVIHQLFFTKTAKRLRLKNLVLFILLLVSLAFIGKIKDRFKEEYETMMVDSSVNDVIGKPNAPVYNVSIKQAWTNKTFNPNDYFPGTAFRVYQFRIFTEMLQEDNIFFTGYGLNASYPKIEQKTVQYNLFLGNQDQEGYQKKNFHNQYIQNFAELGIVGLLLLIAMLFINLKNGIYSKDFVHIAFAVLMISLFLTESFLWRQRGVMFFTMLYCLLNARAYTVSEKEPI
jgi:hypothetical protein